MEAIVLLLLIFGEAVPGPVEPLPFPREPECAFCRDCVCGCRGGAICTCERRDEPNACRSSSVFVGSVYAQPTMARPAASVLPAAAVVGTGHRFASPGSYSPYVGSPTPYVWSPRPYVRSPVPTTPYIPAQTYRQPAMLSSPVRYSGSQANC